MASVFTLEGPALGRLQTRRLRLIDGLGQSLGGVTLTDVALYAGAVALGVGLGAGAVWYQKRGKKGSPGLRGAKGYRLEWRVPRSGGGTSKGSATWHSRSDAEKAARELRRDGVKVRGPIPLDGAHRRKRR